MVSLGSISQFLIFNRRNVLCDILYLAVQDAAEIIHSFHTDILTIFETREG